MAVKIAPLVLQPEYFLSPYQDNPGISEREMFYFFRDHVAPYMTHLFDADFWPVITMQASQVYPAVWHGILAMAAMKQMKQMKKEALNASIANRMRLNYTFGLKQCNKTIQYLGQIRDFSTPREQEMLLITCNVLIGYCNLLEDPAQAQAHLTHGLNLVKHWWYWKRTPSLGLSSRFPGCIAPIASIDLLFLQMEMQLFTSPFPLSEYSWDFNRQNNESHEHLFLSPTEAYLEVLDIYTSCKRLTVLKPPSPGSVKPNGLQNDMQSLKDRFSVKRTKLHNYLAVAELDQSKVENVDDSLKLSVLQIWEICGQVIFNINPKKESLAWDDFNWHFERIVIMCEAALNQGNNSGMDRPHSKHKELPSGYSRSLLSLIGHALQVVMGACRVRRTAHRAITLQKLHPYLDGVYDSKFNTEVALARLKLENDYAEAASAQGTCACQARRFVCNDHRVCFVGVEATGTDCTKMRMKTREDLKNDGTGTVIQIPYTYNHAVLV